MISSAHFSPPISDYDVFNEGKTQSFFESQQAVMTLCTYLEGINKNMEEPSKNPLFEHFNKLLQVSIFYISTLHGLGEYISKRFMFSFEIWLFIGFFMGKQV